MLIWAWYSSSLIAYEEFWSIPCDYLQHYTPPEIHFRVQWPMNYYVSCLVFLKSDCELQSISCDYLQHYTPPEINFSVWWPGPPASLTCTAVTI